MKKLREITSTPNVMTTKQAEMIRDCIFLARTMIFTKKHIYNPYPETITLERINEVIFILTGEYLDEPELRRKLDRH